jgi:hypothetical protein
VTRGECLILEPVGFGLPAGRGRELRTSTAGDLLAEPRRHAPLRRRGLPGRPAGAGVKVFCFDLDDTLLSERECVESGLTAVGSALDRILGLAAGSSAAWLLPEW